MSRKHRMLTAESEKDLNSELAPEKDKKEGVTQTIYTHGKIFKDVPASTSLEDFLRDKYPDEYLDEHKK